MTLGRALGALALACVLFSGSMILFLRRKSAWSFVQILGAGCLVVVVLTHVRRASLVDLDALGDMSTALVITSICGVQFLTSDCFPSDISFTRSPGETYEERFDVSLGQSRVRCRMK